MTPRVRIAPSPTGFLHIGNARSALFNWLFARHTGGIFIVRIDDTDVARSDPAFEADILEGLRWLGLGWDEGVGVGGSHGTYRQSDRFDHYRAAAERLVESGHAYPCFCTPAELEARRADATREGRPPGYDGRCRAIPPVEAAGRRAGGEPSSIRFAMPRPGTTTFQDLVRGELSFDHAHVDDFVLLRSDSTPTYHLASTVDDIDYEISHVIRGEDLLPSTARHIQLTLALGAEPVRYAHLPLLFGPDGRKLSKRHGDTSLRAYREAGYLPEAMFNYLSLLGWSLGGEVTVFGAEEAVAAFDLGSVSRNPAVFDPVKLQWMNGEYVRGLDLSGFVERVRPFLTQGLGRDLDAEEWDRFGIIAPLVQERVKLLGEAADQVRFLYVDELAYDETSWSKVMGAESVGRVLEEATSRLRDLPTWLRGPIEEALRGMLADLGIGARRGLQPIRVAVTGSSVSPPLFESLEVLGRDRALRRLEEARRRLG